MSLPLLATDYACTPDQTITLSADVVLTGSDTVSYAGTAGHNCILNGAGHVFRGVTSGATTWMYVTWYNVGTVSTPAVSITSTGTVTFTHNLIPAPVFPTLQTSGKFNFILNTSATATISFNVENGSLVPINQGNITQVSNDYGLGRLAWLTVSGNTSANPSATIQGNIYTRSYVDVSGLANALFGDSGACNSSVNSTNSNISTGYVGGLLASSTTIVRGNYLHPFEEVMPQGVDGFGASEISNLTGGGTVCDNVFYAGQWQLHSTSANEIVSYNVFWGHTGHYNIGLDHTGNSLYHNIIGQAIQMNRSYYDWSIYQKASEPLVSIQAGTASVYNNTIDDSDIIAGNGLGIAVGVSSGNIITTAKDNAINGDLLLSSSYSAISMSEAPSGCPVRALYLDYNAFNYRGGTTTSYGICITGHTYPDSGYGSHDVGQPNGNTAFQFAGPLPVGCCWSSSNSGSFIGGFPFQDADIIAGATTVPTMLNYFRAVYTPAVGSPLRAAADDGGEIGAVQVSGAPAAWITNTKPALVVPPSLFLFIGTVDTTAISPTCAAAASNVACGILTGYAGDDGLPGGTLSATWSKVSGPGTVTFTRESNGVVSVKLTAAGTYVLRLTATDGSLSNTADKTVYVYAPHPRIWFDPTKLAALQAKVAGSYPNWTGSSADFLTLISGTPTGGSYNVQAIITWASPAVTITTCTNANPMVCTSSGTLPFTMASACHFGNGSGNWAALNTTSTSTAFTCTETSSTTFSVNVNASAYGAYGAQALAVWIVTPGSSYFQYGTAGEGWYYACEFLGIAFAATGDTHYSTQALAILDYINLVAKSGNYAPFVGTSGAYVNMALAFSYDYCFSQLSAYNFQGQNGNANQRSATANTLIFAQLSTYSQAAATLRLSDTGYDLANGTSGGVYTITGPTQGGCAPGTDESCYYTGMSGAWNFGTYLGGASLSGPATFSGPSVQ